MASWSTFINVVGAMEDVDTEQIRKAGLTFFFTRDQNRRRRPRPLQLQIQRQSRQAPTSAHRVIT